ncbi:MAG: hypothetical protein LBD25_08230 [Coriobacteriales bacterium]|jgi:hypothetical protein|nr:hypothetical protein [Coriobacteriales bacterium]
MNKVRVSIVTIVSACLMSALLFASPAFAQERVTAGPLEGARLVLPTLSKTYPLSNILGDDSTSTGPHAGEVEVSEATIPLLITPDAPPAPESEATDVIYEQEPPLADHISSTWALANLLLAVIPLAAIVLLFVNYFRKGEGRLSLHLICLVAALAPLAAFFMTENLQMPLVFVDDYTLLMATLACIQTAVAVVALRPTPTVVVRTVPRPVVPEDEEDDSAADHELLMPHGAHQGLKAT